MVVTAGTKCGLVGTSGDSRGSTCPGVGIMLNCCGSERAGGDGRDILPKS